MSNHNLIKKHSQHFIVTNDKVIRFALKEKLERECYDKNTKIVEELGLTHGAARVDIAVVNGVLHGYELKSDKDTLNRLPDQIKIYNAVLDKVTLVVGRHHLHHAIKIVPDWWGITVARSVEGGSKIHLLNIRESDLNPSQDLYAIAALLWRDEALVILESLNKAVGIRSKNRNVLYQKLVDELSADKLKQFVRDTLKARINWRFDLP